MRPTQPSLRLNSLPKFLFAALALAILAGGLLVYASRNGNISAKANVVSKSVPDSGLETKRQVMSEYGRLPLAFEPNRGQSDPEVKYMARGSGYTLFLTSDEAVLSMSKPAKRGTQPSSSVVRMKVAGARTDANIAPSERQAGISNYFIGNDPAKWQTNVPQYARVNYEGVYPGVDLTFHGAQRQMEFDFVVRPHADAKQIELKFSGTRRLRADESGDLILSTAAGDVRLHKPVAYQENAGTRSPIEARFALSGSNEVKFAVGSYDRDRELVIDPMVSYATYIGGSGEDQATSVAVDSSGNAYITGEAGNATFPHSAGTFGGGPHDAFVFKLNAAGTTQLYSTIFGGSGDDSGNGIAIDASGNAYVAGGTGSPNFPVTAGVFQGTLNGTANAFVAKLDASGAISYATYLGGSSGDTAVGIAIDSSFNTYVTGEADSSNFPTHNAFQSTFGGSADAFVTELNPTASALVYSTYLGGAGVDNATGIAVTGGKIYVTGNTIPPGSGSVFPVTSGVFQSTAGGGADAFVSKLDPAQTGSASLVYSTLLGGLGDEQADAIAVDGSGTTYVTGSTTSPNFPLSSPSQGLLSGSEDAFLTKLNATATVLNFSTYLGGTGADVGVGVALDGANNIYVTGQTTSTDFPTVNPTQASFGGGSNDAFISEYVSSTLVFSTYLGGTGQEDVTSTGVSGAVAVDASNNIYVVGDTSSADFPTVAALQASFGGGVADAFLAKLAPSPVSPDFTLSATALSPASISAGASATSTVTVTPTNGFAGAVTFSCGVVPALTSPPACSFNPASVNGTGTSTLTVTTTSSTPHAGLRQALPLYAAWLPICGVALLGIRNRKALTILLGVIAICGLLFLGACGGGSGSGGGGGGGGTPTTYTVTVTGTSGALSHSQALTLTVN